MPRTQLLIPAAGMGLRLGCDGPKALIDVAGKPLLVRTLERFQPLNLLSGTVVIVPAGFEAAFEAALEKAFPRVPISLVTGGAERQISVSNGLNALGTDTEIVAIHDAARPFVSTESVAESIEAADQFGAATVAVPSIDTILVGDADSFLIDTPDRARLWACQTPQTFRVSVIREAHAAAKQADYLGTDDATLVQRTGHTVKLVRGTPLNFKVTTPEDLALARCVVEKGLA
ncbi:MAG: 2-C-methyl-D-erythritol 4-phosphate cytidylyltransferase [Candidatus Hydrogenedentes bacterium]|nr:2-C-methyl-D-erythritol 4-phosphate cytidylyltransferase [Candidatus Hydrogenedentota bacterium]